MGYACESVQNFECFHENITKGIGRSCDISIICQFQLCKAKQLYTRLASTLRFASVEWKRRLTVSWVSFALPRANCPTRGHIPIRGFGCSLLTPNPPLIY